MFYIVDEREFSEVGTWHMEKVRCVLIFFWSIYKKKNKVRRQPHRHLWVEASHGAFAKPSKQTLSPSHLSLSNVSWTQTYDLPTHSRYRTDSHTSTWLSYSLFTPQHFIIIPSFPSLPSHHLLKFNNLVLVCMPWLQTPWPACLLVLTPEMNSKLWMALKRYA